MDGLDPGHPGERNSQEDKTKQADGLEEDAITNLPHRSWPLFNLGAKPYSKGKKFTNDKGVPKNEDGTKSDDKEEEPVVIQEIGASSGGKVVPKKKARLILGTVWY
ncbi:hypothetical protein R1flu_008702 [Riccia fluitans]|uniref:Uncharacterized protein n=1 Tax=Riccia fluitans TaxID=41844 RepID=A0ABD1YFJ9_9MARC